MIRVLVVDDDFMVARVNRGFFDAVPGFRVVEVALTGEAALQAVRHHEPNLVLLDIHLPDINGLQLLPMLRQAHPELDAVVITAAREAETVRHALRSGIVHYLLKPFSAADLQESLRHYEQSYLSLREDDQTHQHEVNRVFRPGAPTVAARLPKNLSPETADLVAQALRDAGADLSASECADLIGLARVSVRRYLEHFVTLGRVSVRLRYGGVGRPERRYAWGSPGSPGSRGSPGSPGSPSQDRPRLDHQEHR